MGISLKLSVAALSLLAATGLVFWDVPKKNPFPRTPPRRR